MAIPYNDLVPGVHIHHPLQGDIGTTDLSSLPSVLIGRFTKRPQ